MQLRPFCPGRLPAPPPLLLLSSDSTGPKADEERLGTDSASETSRRRVLVVEDNTATLQLVRHILSPTYDVVTAHDLPSALRSAKDGSYDAALVDINLGRGVTGYDVLARLRALSSWQDQPIGAVTAYTWDTSEDSLLERGFTGFLPKPFRRNELLTFVQSLLDTVS